jgi:drug/metabolite transporter (DMT)-like permease
MSRGVLLCLLSSAGFGAMAVLAKEAYAAGVGVMALVALRLAIAAPLLWAAAAVRGGLRDLPAREAGRGLLLGLVPFAAQALLFFGAVERLDAAVAELLVFTYPAIVLGAGVLLGRTALDARLWGVLALALGGAALVLLGAGASGGAGLEGVGVAMALLAAVAYAAYLLTAEALGGRTDGVVLAALVTTGGAVTTAVLALATGSLDLDLGSRAWALLVALGVGCTAGPLVALYAGLRHVGAATASILSLVEPVVTVALAAALLGEHLAPLQVAGALLVLGAIVLTSLPARGARRAEPALAPA